MIRRNKFKFVEFTWKYCMIQSENKLELQEYREMFCKFRIKDMMNLKFELAIWKPQASKPYEIV